MANVMGMRSGNPALTADTFTRHGAASGNLMTLQGTVNKTAMSLVILLIAAAYVWNRGLADPISVCGSEVVLAGFVVALVTTFKPVWAPFTTPVYAALEGPPSAAFRSDSRRGIPASSARRCSSRLVPSAPCSSPTARE